MEPQRVAIASYSTSKTCFITVPHSWVTDIRDNTLVVYQVEYGEDRNRAYFSWSGETTSTDRKDVIGHEIVEINSTYAQKLKIRNGDQLLVRQIRGIQSCTQVMVEPVSTDDWEILELNANLLQSLFLTQTRVVWIEQVFPLWITKSVVIFLKIKKLSVSGEVGILEQLTEIHVEPKSANETVNIPTSSSSDASFSQTTFQNSSSTLEDKINDRGSDKNEAEVNEKEMWSFSKWIVNKAVECAALIYGDEKEENQSSSETQVEKAENTLNVVKNTANECDLRIPLRVHPMPQLENDEEKNISTVYISKSSLPPNFIQTSSLLLCTLSKILSPEDQYKRLGKEDNKQQKPKRETETSDSQVTRVPNCVVKVVIVEKTMPFNNFVVRGCVVIPDSLRRHLGLEIRSKVLIKSIPLNIITPSSVTVHGISHVLNPVEVKQLLKNVELFLESASALCSPLVATNGTLLPVKFNEQSYDVLLSFPPPRNSSNSNLRTVYLFSFDDVRNDIVLGVQAKELHKANAEVILPQYRLTENLDHSWIDDTFSPGGMCTQISSGVEFLRLSLLSDPDSLSLTNFGSTSLLVTGNRGSGKSTVAIAICRQVSQVPYFVHVHVIKCKSLKGKRIENICELWQRALVEAIYRAPSVIVFDDLDQIIGPTTVGDANSTDSNADHAAHAFLNLFSAEILARNRVALVVTSLSKENLHTLLTLPRGRQFFPSIISIPPLNQENRTEILRCLLDQCEYDVNVSVDLDELAKKLDGAIASDLKLFLNRVRHSACSRQDSIDAQCVIQQNDFEVAFEGFVPSALKGLRTHQSTEKGWTDVGGLERVKKTLQEIFTWPSKFPKLFAQCPLNLCSGVLLYGPPGTGKTLLASVLAKECSLNFISIKGPELLSKYIGASEQAVRDLFVRAQAANPCILFFDEFDALAPRRGHDSTGVTDRVVNQLLTQLDGVEGRQGVYLLAATSRPDLIDPALLRPGRLDKCLHCPLPTQDELAEIIRAMCRSMTNLDSSSVNFNRVASQCQHFTGADVQALLYNAQLMVIHSMDTPEFVDVSSTCDDSWLYFDRLSDGVTNRISSEKKTAIEKELDVLVSNSVAPTLEIHRAQPRHALSSNSPNPIPVVTEDLLIKSALDMNPSVSSSERNKYERIYENFTKSRGGDFVDVNTANIARQKTTLA